MTWFRIDDTWGTHPKVLALTPRAKLLWVYGGLHCAQHLTDGRIERTAVKALAAVAGVPATAAKELVTVGLWTDEGDHYLMHDFDRYQPSREQVEKQRARWTRSKHRSRHPDNTVDSTQESTEESTVDVEGVSTVDSTGVSTLSRPDPSPTTPEAAASDSRGLPVEQRRQHIQQAIDVLTDRHLDRTPTIGRNPDRHRDAVHRGKLTDHQQQAHQLLRLRPDLTAEQLADLLEPATAPPAPYTSDDDLLTMPQEPGVDHGTPDCPCDGNGWWWPDGPDNGAAHCPGPAPQETAA